MSTLRKSALPLRVLLLLLAACGAGSGGAGEPDASDCFPALDLPPDAAPPPCACGDGLCDGSCGECLVSCPYDCRSCGDGACSPGERPESCPEDCCGGCGDGLCMGFGCGEDAATCPADCGNACGDASCGKGESPGTCPEDCAWQVCGNGVCEPIDGGPAACSEDCGGACGDCRCSDGEDWTSCPIDCGYCGDAVCSPCAALLESADTCDECAATCAPACAGAVCGSGGCADQPPWTCGVCPVATGCLGGRCLPDAGPGVDRGDGTIVFAATGLVWEAAPDGEAAGPDEARLRCEGLGLAGGGWRLPAIDELRTLIAGCPWTAIGGPCPAREGCRPAFEDCMDGTCWACLPGGGPRADGCYVQAGVGGTCGTYWSATVTPWSPSYGFAIGFDAASIGPLAAGETARVRCVRDEK